MIPEAFESNDRLRSYEDLLATFGPKLGLLGPNERTMIWERHVLDSLRGMKCLAPDDGLVVDVGSGGGLPGIPLAVAAPRREFVLLEPNRRRVSFLEMVVDRLGLDNVSVLSARAESAALQADVCLARAFAPPERAWKETNRLLNHRGRLIYYAGRSWNHAMEIALERCGALSSICQDARFAWQGPIVSISRVRAT